MNDKLESSWPFTRLSDVDVGIEDIMKPIDEPLIVDKDPRKKLMKIKNVRKLKKNKRIVIINKQVKQI